MSAGHALGHQTLPRHFYLPRGKHACFFLGIPNRCRRSEGDPKLCQRPLINRSSRAHFVGRALLSFTAARSAGEKSGSERKQPPALHKEGPREHAEHARLPPRGAARLCPGCPVESGAAQGAGAQGQLLPEAHKAREGRDSQRPATAARSKWQPGTQRCPPARQ